MDEGSAYWCPTIIQQENFDCAARQCCGRRQRKLGAFTLNFAERAREHFAVLVIGACQRVGGRCLGHRDQRGIGALRGDAYLGARCDDGLSIRAGKYDRLLLFIQDIGVPARYGYRLLSKRRAAFCFQPNLKDRTAPDDIAIAVPKDVHGRRVKFILQRSALKRYFRRINWISTCIHRKFEASRIE